MILSQSITFEISVFPGRIYTRSHRRPPLSKCCIYQIHMTMLPAPRLTIRLVGVIMSFRMPSFRFSSRIEGSKLVSMVVIPTTGTTKQMSKQRKARHRFRCGYHRRLLEGKLNAAMKLNRTTCFQFVTWSRDTRNHAVVSHSTDRDREKRSNQTTVVVATSASARKIPINQVSWVAILIITYHIVTHGHAVGTE
jgi:hypothetical protein